MDRRELLLTILAAAGGEEYSPVQIQKAAFIITKNLPEVCRGAATFNFTPYDYGPFDPSVYQEAEHLQAAGFARVQQGGRGRWRTYAASQAGVQWGQASLNALLPHQKEYIERVSAWVRALDFATLVKSVYEAYPEMREKSIFRG